MAPRKRLAHSTNNSSILNELVAIRNAIQLAQQNLTRLERTLNRTSRQNSSQERAQERQAPPNMPAQRRLLQNIANRPLPNPVCWQHRMHGQATRQCNGPPCPYYVEPTNEQEVQPQPQLNNPMAANENVMEDDLLRLSDSE